LAVEHVNVQLGLAQFCASLQASCAFGKPGLAPAGDLLFFASPKKPKEKKGDPMVWVPSLRYGQAAVRAASGVELKLAALRQSLALIRFRLCSSAQPDGWGKEYGFGEVRTRKARPSRSSITYPNPNSLLNPLPFCMRRGAQGQTDQDGRLSEPKASSSPAPAGPSTAACPAAQRRGRRQQGRLFFGDFLLAKQKKVTALSGARPDIQPRAAKT
jgi:hypothetical protein